MATPLPLTQVEAYQEGQIWKAILPLPTKNMKNGSPETFTSPTVSLAERACPARCTVECPSQTAAAAHVQRTLRYFDSFAAGRVAKC